ncbi:MAG: ABC-2 family transporter protein [Filifactoraceae bacterium]
MRIYFELFIAKLKMLAMYKQDFCIGICSSLLESVFSLLFIQFIFANFDSIGDVSQNGARYLYFSISFAQSMIQFLFLGLISFSDIYIRGGELDVIYLKPVNDIAYVIFDNINIKEIPNVLISMVLFIWSITQLNSQLHGRILLFLLSFVVVGIVFAFAMLVNCLSFKYKDTLMGVKFIIALTDFGRYPLEIFGYILKMVMTLFFPIALANYIPLLFIDHLWLVSIISFSVVIILNTMALKLFRYSSRSYESLGS